MPRELNIPNKFIPKDREDQIYQNWESKGYFTAHVNPDKKPFTIVMPPPNITGQLHMGHALDNTLQDILIRWRRMQGYEALWLPGTDHASIATEAKVVEKLASEGKSKEDLGREAFLAETWAWKEKYGKRITEQLRKLACSCDWSRERFTLDDGLSDAVYTVFEDLYKRDLIYRGTRMLNWCPSCQTTISDIEVIYDERSSHLWHFKYPLEDGSGYVEVATTRPETMLGDTAVAVHPEDTRYQDIIGKYVILPIVGRRIPIIADTYVESEFGTGCVKITPAHDPNDYEIGLRHNLEFVEVMDQQGKMNTLAGPFAGMTREACRKAIVPALEKEGALGEIEDYIHKVGNCQRCSTTVEPRVSAQWFVRMKPLATPAIEAVRNGNIQFVPKHTEKTYFNWLENIEDWNISRQLWWGHRIPAWYCQGPGCDYVYVGRNVPEICPTCGSEDIVQDEDTLDTWFSSALWPFSTLGWPDETEDYKYFYPTSTLSTGFDIIFFWVARMIFQGIDQTGQVPFQTVFLHGMVRDSQGRKMSKSLNNGIDPLDIIEHFGTDALRYALINNTAPGNDQRFNEETVEAGRAFVNKIWNAFRFVMMNLEEEHPDYSNEPLQLEDRWILSSLHSTIDEVTKNLENYELGLALASIYEFFWDKFCDWYIEMVKPRLFDKNSQSRSTAQYVLVYVLDNALRLLHPFMPFVTEEIFQHLPKTEQSIMISQWPNSEEERIDKDAERQMQVVFEAIIGIRQLRNEMGVSPKLRIQAILDSDDEATRNYFLQAANYLERLAGVSTLELAEGTDWENPMLSMVFSKGTIFIPQSEMLDLAKELNRLREEEASLLSDIAHSDKMLKNEAFIRRAPEQVVQKEKEKRESIEEKLRAVQGRIASLAKNT